MAAQDTTIQFDFNTIPESARQSLLAIIHQEAVEYLKQPGVAEKFEAWKAERDRKRSERRCEN